MNEVKSGVGREVWIDVARGIGIILVVYGHIAGGIFNADFRPISDRWMLLGWLV